MFYIKNVLIFFILFFEGTFGCKSKKKSKLEIIDRFDFQSMFYVELEL